MVTNNICDDFLKKLGEIQNMSLAGEKATQFANCEQFSSFYGVWITELKELGVEQISMFELSLREYTLSLLFVASGLYKQAMASLRFSLEYTLFSIMLSSSELNYRLWKTHQKDECWAETIHAQTGVYGSVFIQAFAPELKNHGASLQTLARDVYRECSEYVHGNYEVMQALRILEYSGVVYEHSKGIRATRDGLGTRYAINVGCLLSAESTPLNIGLNIVRRITIKRMTEFGANYKSYDLLPDIQEVDMTNVLREHLKLDMPTTA